MNRQRANLALKWSEQELLNRPTPDFTPINGPLVSSYDGQIIAVGEKTHTLKHGDERLPGCGGVLVIDRSLATTQILIPPKPQAMSFSGNSVKISRDGRLIFISAFGMTSQGVPGAGEVHIYKDLTLVETLSEPSETGSYGNTLAASATGDALLVGANNYQLHEVDKAGVVFAYERTAGGWKHTQTLSSPYEGVRFFGRQIAISGSGCVAFISGAYGDRSALPNWVGVFIKTDKGWSHVGDIFSPDKFAPSFGTSIATDYTGRTVVIGTPNQPSSRPRHPSGYASVYTLQNDVWIGTPLISLPSVMYQRFGCQVQISDDASLIAVAAMKIESAYTPKLANGRWSLYSRSDIDQGYDPVIIDTHHDVMSRFGGLTPSGQEFFTGYGTDSRQYDPLLTQIRVFKPV